MPLVLPSFFPATTKKTCMYRFERIWTDVQPQEGFTRGQSSSSSPTDMSSRPTSPSSLMPFRFGVHSDNVLSRVVRRDSKHPDNPDERKRKISTRSKTQDKGKELYNGKVSVDSTTSPTSTSSDFSLDPLPSWYNTSTSFVQYGRARPSSSDGPSTAFRKPRGTLLGAASDALSFKFGRKKQFIRQPSTQIILPDVIEISAPRRDEEVEERHRLRDMAAQSIGLPVAMHPDTHSLDDSVEEEEEEEEIRENGVSANHEPESQHATNMRWGSMPNFVTKSPHESSVLIATPSSALPNRLRSGSLLGHSRSNSATAAPVPHFPTTATALVQLRQAAISLQKYYPPSSLRIFALSSMNWKNRYMVLSSSTTLVNRGSSPQASYLHLFKSSNGEEKEIERLEINEDSVVFVAEAEVGGRKHVVKVGGVDVGALKKELNCEEGGRTMWFLHISDPAEAQKWISTIKTTILGQRTMRAGLGLPANTLGGIEPRGDMDVMLSMHAQGFIASPPLSSPRQLHTRSQSPSSLDRNYAASISSHRSQATVSKPVSSGPVTTLKGLFSATRPRASSRAATIASERPHREHDEAGNQPNNIHVTHPPPSPIATPIISHSNISFSDSIVHPEHRLERKILSERSALWGSAEPTPIVKDRASRTLSLGALSLQPPPRKRWTSVSPTPGMEPVRYRYMNGSATRITNTSNRTFEKESEPMVNLSSGTSKQKPRPPSIQSVSTAGSGDITFSTERSSSSTKQSSTKRWSRQGVLPRRLTPPSGPPPSVPSGQLSPSRTVSHPYAGDRPSSRASSAHSTASQKSVISNLPSFSKRASSSSAFSFTTSNSSHSNSSRPTSMHINRSSMPPPRPAPTSSLPLAPDQDAPHSDPGPMSKSSLRDSLTNRAFRLSMSAPKPPPSSVLPPRPDEPDYRSHRRNSSTGSYTHPPHSDPLPTIPQALATSPFPPPLRPLPPTPISTSLTSSTPPSRPISRVSIKQRLRKLSAPSSPVQTTSEISNECMPPTPPPSGAPASAVPTSPIAQKIMPYQNEPSFLQIYSPASPFLQPPRSPPPPEQLPELTSLSPPPRRGSKHIIIGSEEPVVEDEKPPAEGEQKMMSLSRPGSVISLAIVSM